MVLITNSLALDAVIILSTGFLFLYYYFTKTFNHWKDKGVPFLVPTPFFGNVKDLTLMRISGAKQFQQLYNQLKGNKYGGIFQSRSPHLLILDPELIKLVMVKDFQHFHDRGITIDEKRNPLAAHLFNIGGIRWRILRTKLTPTFTSGKMKLMFNLIEECGKELAELVKESAEKCENVEVRDILAKYSTDVIGTCAFGLQFNSMKNPNSEFRRMGRKIFEPSIGTSLRRTLIIGLPSVARFFNIRFTSNIINNFFLKVVKETVDFREQENIERNDFLQLLIQIKNKGKVDDDEDKNGSAKDKNGQSESYDKTSSRKMDFELTDSLLAAQAFVFFLAGFETSSTTMSFCLHELAVNPDIQVLVQEEIDSVLSKYNGKVTYEGIHEMVYLDKVVNETLRKYPPVSNLTRKCTISYTIPGTNVRLEEGTRVIIPAYAIQNDPEYYPDPERFDPERFSEENKKTRPNYTFLPFGEGPRICIGMRFGLVQTKVGLVSLLSKYQFSVGEKTQVPLVIDPKSLVIAAKGGILLKISNRS